MNTQGRWLVLMTLVLLHGPVFATDGSEDQRPLNAAQLARLQERDRHGEQYTSLRAQGKIPEAIAEIEAMLTIEGEVLGNSHDDAARSLLRLAQLHQYRDDFDAAHDPSQTLGGSSRALRTRRLGEHLDARLDLEYLEYFARQDADRRRELTEAAPVCVPGFTSSAHRGNTRRHSPCPKTAEKIRRRLLTDGNREYANSLEILAQVYHGVGDYPKAVELYQQALTCAGNSWARTTPITHQPLRRGEGYYETRDYPKAVKSISRLSTCAGSYWVRTTPATPPASTAWRWRMSAWATTQGPGA